jgi:very-short-patch-repair endonuclease
VKHEFARRLRREQTNVERKLWLALRARRFHGAKFRRQQPIGAYIVDFVSFETKLVIELDGDQHGSEDGLAYDARRTQALAGDGFRVLRFANHEVNANFDGVLEAIARALHACAPSPVLSRVTRQDTLSHKGRGEEPRLASKEDGKSEGTT